MDWRAPQSPPKAPWSWVRGSGPALRGPLIKIFILRVLKHEIRVETGCAVSLLGDIENSARPWLALLFGLAWSSRAGPETSMHSSLNSWRHSMSLCCNLKVLRNGSTVSSFVSGCFLDTYSLLNSFSSVTKTWALSPVLSDLSKERENLAGWGSRRLCCVQRGNWRSGLVLFWNLNHD